MTDPRTRMGALKAVGLGILGSFVLNILGAIGREMMPGPWGQAADGFFSVLGTAFLSHGVAPLFWQKHMSAAALSRSVRVWLALATGAALIIYLEADGGFSGVDIAVSVVVCLALVPMAISWFRLLRREATAPLVDRESIS